MIISLIESDGGTLKKAATTNGGEYCGACPFCGGKDRFRVWPGTGRYWCRGCNKQGDEIDYLRERRGLSFQGACSFLGRDPGERKDKPAPATWTPKESKTPGELWQSKARAFLDVAIKNLWTPGGERLRQWLKAEKGLSDAIIKEAMLGYMPIDNYESREAWGLETALKENGTEKRLWIPAGLVIPLISQNNVIRLRIRRDAPSDGKRYVYVSGSSPAPLIIGKDKAAYIIVESELDAWLLAQEAGDLCGTVALGTATAKPDKQTHELLKNAALILISLDTDETGINASWKFWPETYGGKVKRWPTIHGKDASEAKANDLDLRTWIIAGMFGSEEKFERFAIQTIDGGLTDWEAIAATGN
ncbi:MAG: DNA primase [Candidatus Aerophobetes bacterium ADurb.Bin490]|nr:MAG: DNA primase [Candidatus Aerophobetes bacterium ADurb.Bin490]